MGIEISMNRLYIMCGLAFSGKSTLAKKIALQTGSKLIAFDKLWIEKDKMSPIPKGVEGWKYIRSAAQDEILAALKAGESVVYDENNPRKEHRDELRRLAKEAGVSATIIYLDTSLNVIREREAANKTSQERHDVEPENFEKVMADMDIPTSDENVISFTPETNIDDFIKSLSL